MTKEKWKDYPLTNGEYQISNFGNARCWLKCGVRNRERLINPRLLKLSLNGNGYPCIQINLIESGVKKNVRIHRAVGELFIPNPNNLPLVLHIDDVKTNCHYTNLKWGTSLENNRDAMEKGINIPAKGQARGKSNLTDKTVKLIFNLKGKKTSRELGKIYGVYHSSILSIWNGLSWNHITGLPCTRKIKPKFSKDIKFKE